MVINPSSATSLVREVVSNTYARTMRFDFKSKERIKVLIGEKTLNCLLLTNASGIQIACTTLRESVTGISAYHVCYMGYQAPVLRRHQEEDIFGYPKFPCIMMKNGKEHTVWSTEDFNYHQQAGWVPQESLENSSPAA